MSKQKPSVEDICCLTCEICIEPILQNQKFINSILCSHSFCLECIVKYIEVKVLDNAVNIKCPGLDCEHLLDPLSFNTVITPTLFLRWCDTVCENSVLELDKSYCPNKVCSELVVNECPAGSTVKKSTCPNCKEDFCFQCKVEWHAGHLCQETAERQTRSRNIDFLFRQLEERMEWARCPACLHCVERKSGCYVITCRCKTKFCYYCGRKVILTDGHGYCDCSKAEKENRRTACTILFIFMCLPIIILIISLIF